MWKTALKKIYLVHSGLLCRICSLDLSKGLTSLYLDGIVAQIAGTLYVTISRPYVTVFLQIKEAESWICREFLQIPEIIWV